jgi:hypothetical protein
MATKKKATKKANKLQFTNVLLEVPMVICVDSKHEFRAIQAILKKLNHKLRCEEIDSKSVDNPYFILGSGYWGLIYHGKRPSKKAIIELMVDIT